MVYLNARKLLREMKSWGHVAGRKCSPLSWVYWNSSSRFSSLVRVRLEHKKPHIFHVRLADCWLFPLMLERANKMHQVDAFVLNVETTRHESCLRWCSVQGYSDLFHQTCYSNVWCNCKLRPFYVFHWPQVSRSGRCWIWRIGETGNWWQRWKVREWKRCWNMPIDKE